MPLELKRIIDYLVSISNCGGKNAGNSRKTISKHESPATICFSKAEGFAILLLNERQKNYKYMIILVDE